MAYINGNEQILIQTTLKGDSVFIRYSANADGTDFTETWSDGQNYIGTAVAQEAPTDKSGYIWSRFIFDIFGDFAEGTIPVWDSEKKVFISSEKTVDSFVKFNGNSDSLMKIFAVGSKAEPIQKMLYVKSGFSVNDTYDSVVMRSNVNNAKHPGTFEIAPPELDTSKTAYSANHPVTVGVMMSLIGDIETTLDSIIAIQEALLGGAV